MASHFILPARCCGICCHKLSVVIWHEVWPVAVIYTPKSASCQLFYCVNCSWTTHQFSSDIHLCLYLIITVILPVPYYTCVHLCHITPAYTCVRCVAVCSNHALVLCTLHQSFSSWHRIGSHSWAVCQSSDTGHGHGPHVSQQTLREISEARWTGLDWSVLAVFVSVLFESIKCAKFISLRNIWMVTIRFLYERGVWYMLNMALNKFCKLKHW